MDYLYKTIEKKARSETVIEKSKFIATVVPCSTREEAELFFREIKDEFRDATHNVPAFIVGNKMELKWASDDGEPQGTAGPPILRLLEMREITNLAVVVTRYFGGIKLGTGGLVRAYTESVEAVIEEAGLAGAREFIKFPCEMDYGLYNRIVAQGFPAELKEYIQLGKPEFQENVSVEIGTPIELEDKIKGVLMELSNGSITIKDGAKVILPVSLTSD